MSNRYTFHTSEKIAQARLAFRQLSISGPEDGDRFFEAFGPGNTVNIADRPFERFEDYEELLGVLKEDDPKKYDEIHKGTPFYFLAWTAFDLKNYEKAVFYMDAAISEDMRKDPTSWLDNPASQFLTLNHEGNQAATRITRELNKAIVLQLTRFNAISSLAQILLSDFVDKFVKVLVNKKENHSIITAFYSYVLEYQDRLRELELRSSEGGSIEPALTFLFKGGLLFESLLKYLYPTKNNGADRCKTLGDIFNTTSFKTDFPLGITTSASSLAEIIAFIGSDITTAFNVTARLRNTSGHNLVWDDIFTNTENFTKLFEQQINALFFVILKKFC